MPAPGVGELPLEENLLPHPALPGGDVGPRQHHPIYDVLTLVWREDDLPLGLLDQDLREPGPLHAVVGRMPSPLADLLPLLWSDLPAVLPAPLRRHQPVLVQFRR